MTLPKLAGIHHVKIPVTDLTRSVEWYAKVFGYRTTIEFAEADGEVLGVGGEIPGLECGMTFRVNPQAAKGCRNFDPVSFGVDTKEDVEAWAAHLDGLGIGHSPVIEASIGWLLVFNDPDGIQLHLYTWAEHGKDQSHLPGYGRRVA